jgi:hypothetical protein
MAEVREEPLPDIPAAPRLDVFARAEEAGKFRQLREQALRPDSPDPQVAALRAAAALLDTGDAPSPTPQPAKPKLKTEELSRAEQIVQRLSTTAVDDDGYRVQLIDLAATSGGLYQQALDRVYEIETETLGQAEATARLLLDSRQLVATRERDRRRAARAQLEAAGAAHAQTVRNLVASATADAGFREQLTELARERGGVFAEALAALGKG